MVTSDVTVGTIGRNRGRMERPESNGDGVNVKWVGRLKEWKCERTLLVISQNVIDNQYCFRVFVCLVTRIHRIEPVKLLSILTACPPRFDLECSRGGRN